MKRTRQRVDALAAALSVALLGCDLSPIEPNRCGNGVVEPENHEDCDSRSPSCGATLTKSPCRFLCAIDKDCSPGFRCGTDRVCRRPRAEIAQIGSFPSTGIIGLAAGDVTSDGCDELILSTLTEEVISGFDSRVPGDCGAFERTFRASLKPSELPLAAPVLGAGVPSSALILADRGRSGEGIFELDFIEGELVSRAYLGTPIGIPGRQINGAASARLGLGDGSDAWLLIAGPLPSGPIMPPQMLGPNAVFGLRYPSAHVDLVSPMFEGPPPPDISLATGDLKVGGCDELVTGFAGGPLLVVSSLCPAGPGQGSWIQSALPPITLFGGATLGAPPMMMASPNQKIPPTSTSIRLVDADGDGSLDVLVNDANGVIHIAYGLGDGRFHSTSPPQNPPDQTTSALAKRDDFGITGDFVFAAFPGESPSSPAPHAIIVPLACPTRTGFGTPNCSRAMVESCSADVGDVDGNGLPDVVFTEPELPNFLLYRGTKAGGFTLSSHATTCPPRRTTLSDIDGDGLDDVAFIDARTLSADPNDPHPPVHSLVKVAFGAPSGPPSTPHVVADFDFSLGRPSDEGLGRDQALNAGRFLDTTDGGLLAVAFSTPDPAGMSASDVALAAARLEGTSSRRVVAPFYFPDGPGGEPDPSIHLVQMVRGSFGGAPRIAAVTTQNPGGASATEMLWLLDTSAAASASPPAPQEIDCHGCALAPIDIDGDGEDELAALGNGSIAIYRAEKDLSFGARTELPVAVDFRSDPTTSGGRAGRPAVGDLDDDGRLDILALASSGELVAAFGQDGGSFEVKTVVGAPACTDGAPLPCSTPPSFALIELDGTGLPEVAVVAPGAIHFYDIGADRVFVPLEILDQGRPLTAPPSFTDYTAVVAGDFDGDGVDDMAVARASSFYTIYRGIPVIE